jgi:mannose-6-phosphate isomerase-like protein (cupin superfamily)
MATPMDLRTTYLHLHQGRAEELAGGDSFWVRVSSGELPLPGWLVASFVFDPADGVAGGSSEMHPNGDELHVCVSGAMRAVLERAGAQEVVDFAAGETCLIRRGTWHRLEAREPSRIVSLTFGEGTVHRPAG